MIRLEYHCLPTPAELMALGNNHQWIMISLRNDRYTLWWVYTAFCLSYLGFCFVRWWKHEKNSLFCKIKTNKQTPQSNLNLIKPLDQPIYRRKQKNRRPDKGPRVVQLMESDYGIS